MPDDGFACIESSGLVRWRGGPYTATGVRWERGCLSVRSRNRPAGPSL